MAFKTNVEPVWGTRSAKYDWTSWFDGDKWVLESGTDFSTISAVRNAATKAADREKDIVELKMATQPDGNLIIRAIRGPNRAAGTEVAVDSAAEAA